MRFCATRLSKRSYDEYGSIAKRLALLLIIFCTAGCMPPHVQLSAPKATAPLQERQRAYLELRPMPTAGHPRTLASNSQLPFVLANGLEIFHPADLLPVVLEQSLTDSHAILFERDHRIGTILFGTGFSGIGLGTGLVMTGLVKEGLSLNPWLISGLLMTLVGMAIGLTGVFISHNAAQHRRRAFHSYNADLQERLRLEPANRLEEMQQKGSTDALEQSVEAQDVIVVPAVAPDAPN